MRNVIVEKAMKNPLKPIRLTLLAAALWASGAAPVGAQTPFEPAAVVNDQAITRFDLDQRLRVQSALTGVEINATVVNGVLNAMISDRLRLQAAAEAGVTVSDAEIESGLAEFARRRGATLEEMNARLRSAGVTSQALRDVVHTELAWREVVRRRYGSRSRASDADVERELELLDAPTLDATDPAGGARYEIGFLSVAIDPAASVQKVHEATKQLTDAQQSIRSCEALSAAANDFGPGSGVRQDMSANEIPAPMRDAVTSLVPGQFTDPVRLVDAVVMAMLCSVETQNASDQRTEDVRRQLVQRNFERYADAYLQELRRNAVIEIR